MRFVSLLTNSVTLLILQQAVSLWFLSDFFLARDSSSSNKLFNEYLPSKTTSQTLVQIESLIQDLNLTTCSKSDNLQGPTFDKIVLIVIDAFGAEFLPSLRGDDSKRRATTTTTAAANRMPFLNEALGRNRAMGFIAKAATPTVTMPRIKALISGTIPSFMDIVHNLASDVSDFHDDNILGLARSQNKSIVFYGDDTWLSLFDRSMFLRSRETLSLFASDYTSVDTNVTEMALPETKRAHLDWDYLILHYLGLDHIGHLFGSNEAPLIESKLRQMDDVVREIYTDLSRRADKTLIIVCGDHGMSKEGNHGGDTPLETETAMIFLPINSQLKKPRELQSNRILQVDLAATLSLLAGLPVPRLSRGVIVERLLESIWLDEGQKSTCAIIKNLMQLVRLLDDAELNSPNGLGSQLLELLRRHTRSKSSGELTFNKLAMGQCYELARDIQAHLLRTITAKSNPLLVISAVIIVMLLSLRNLYRASVRLLMPLMPSPVKLACLVIILAPILMQGSTDFIELENIWWVSFAALAVLSFSALAVIQHRRHSVGHDLELFRAMLLLVSFTLAATWNNLKLSGPLDFGWSLPVISVVIMCNHSLTTSELDRKPSSLIFYTIGLCVCVTKMVEETSEETSEREADHIGRIASMQLVTFLILCAATVANLAIALKTKKKTKKQQQQQQQQQKQRKREEEEDEELIQPTSIVQKLATSWMWLIFLLSRSRNYPFLISNVMMEASLNSVSNSLKLSPIVRALMYVNLSSFAFYSQGNTNLFSSLDVKPAFFAQTSYNIWLAVPLVACATCGCQIFWHLKLMQRVQGEKEQERMIQSTGIIIGGNNTRAGDPTPKLIPEGTKRAIKDFVDMRTFLNMAFFMIICTILRNHLFIWSVISPKLVYLYVTGTILRLATETISVVPHLLIWLFQARDSHHRDPIRRTVKEVV